MFDSDRLDKILINLIEVNLGSYTLKISSENPRLFAFWNIGESKWSCKQDIDPLSLYLVINSPERERHREDDEGILTLAKVLNKNTAWVQSFLYGWFGFDNQSNSINGYLVGVKVRNFAINHNLCITKQ